MSGKLSRKVDHQSNQIVDTHMLYQRRNLQRMLMPKRMLMLQHMIDGVPDPMDQNYKWGGEGKASLNCEGGYGFDAVVRQMVKRGEVVIERSPRCGSKFQAYTINRTVAVVTPFGREVYARWKKKNAKRYHVNEIYRGS